MRLCAPHQLAYRHAELAAVQAPAAVGVEDLRARPQRGENVDFPSVGEGLRLRGSADAAVRVTGRIRGATGVAEVLNLPARAGCLYYAQKWRIATLLHCGSCATAVSQKCNTVLC